VRGFKPGRGDELQELNTVTGCTEPRHQPSRDPCSASPNGQGDHAARYRPLATNAGSGAPMAFRDLLNLNLEAIGYHFVLMGTAWSPPAGISRRSARRPGDRNGPFHRDLHGGHRITYAAAVAPWPALVTALRRTTRRPRSRQS